MTISKTRLVVCFLALALASFSARADTQTCLQDARPPKPINVGDCPMTTTPCGSAQAITAPILGVAINAGYASTPIDVYGKCRYIDSVADKTYFVPIATDEEWTAFLAGKPSALGETVCARPFSGVDLGKSLHFGPTSAKPALGDTGDAPYQAVSLPYARQGAVWPPAKESCAGTTQIFNHSCYEDVPTYKCFRTVPQTCTQYKCNASSGGSCSSWTQVSIDCSYCAEPGSTCEKKWHSWSETFDFVATALNSDTENPSWRGQSKRTAGTTRPVACSTRGTQTARDCTGTPTSCTANGTTSCVSGTLKDSCGRTIGNCCAPDGLTYCVGSRKLNSCGTDVGACCPYPQTHCDVMRRTYGGTATCPRVNGCGEVVGTCTQSCHTESAMNQRSGTLYFFSVCDFQ